MGCGHHLGGRAHLGRAERLMRVTEEALYLAIDRARPGNRLQDIFRGGSGHVESNGFSVVRDFVGTASANTA